MEDSLNGLSEERRLQKTLSQFGLIPNFTALCSSQWTGLFCNSKSPFSQHEGISVNVILDGQVV